MTDDQYADVLALAMADKSRKYKIKKFWSPDAQAGGKKDCVIGSCHTMAVAKRLCGDFRSSVKTPPNEAYFLGWTTDP